MSEVEFTKGPWVSVDGTTSGREVLAEKATKAKTRVARCGGPDRDANADLIAAAPDLYDALRDMVEQALGCWQNHSGHEQAPRDLPMPEHIEKAQTALAKARGETP